MDLGLRVSAPSGSELLQPAIRHTVASHTTARKVARRARGSILITPTLTAEPPPRARPEGSSRVVFWADLFQSAQDGTKMTV